MTENLQSLVSRGQSGSESGVLVVSLAKAQHELKEGRYDMLICVKSDNPVSGDAVTSGGAGNEDNVRRIAKLLELAQELKQHEPSKTSESIVSSLDELLALTKR